MSRHFTFNVLFAGLLLMLTSTDAISTSQLARRWATEQNCDATVLSFDRAEFEKLCGDKSDKKHPCFSHTKGDLQWVNVDPFHQPVDVAKEMVIKDEAYSQFTIRDPSHAVMITYLDDGYVRFIYSGFDPSSGCYNITLTRGPSSNWRSSFSDDDGNGRDLDTLHHELTSKKFCTKWGHINVDDGGDMWD